MKAVRTLVRAGIKAGIGIAPILPGITDRPEQLAAVVRAAREAGATHVWAIPLHMRPGTREHFMETLAREWPELLGEYERLYATRAYLPQAATAPLMEQVRALRDRFGIADRRDVRLVPPPQPAQLVLAM
jgi:DNA repair photolyase